MPVRPNRSASANHRTASKIAPRLYLTCLATAKDVAQLADLGITHVVSVIENAPTFPSTHPLRTLHVSLSDYDGEDILTHLPVTTSFIRGALAENPKNRILVRTYHDVLCAKDAASNTVVTYGDLNRFTASWASAGVQLL
jgi:capsule polysaccharide export protein KpsC/LpsZ